MTTTTNQIQRARVATIVLSLLGVALSFVALQQHVVYDNGFATGPSFCHINDYFNCEAVNASEWSTVFGIPVASYGLIFYTLIVLGSVCATTAGRILSLNGWAAIVLTLSTVASVLSVALFAISEFFIGALCLMCLGLYLVNFLTFGIVWRLVWSGQLVEGIKKGIGESVQLLGITVGAVGAPSAMSPWRLRALAVVAALVVAVSVLLPEALYEVYAAREIAQDDPIAQWRNAPVTQFTLQSGGGAFGDYSRGNPNAPITMVEFADYECPACKLMSALIHDLLEKHGDKIFFVFKNYPLDQSCNPEMKRKLHEYACTAAFFSRCAGEQGKFWEANSILFLRDAEKGELSEASLTTEGAKELGLDDVALKECLSSGRYRKKIEQDIAEGSKANLEGTPSVWVNGKLVSQPSRKVFEDIFSLILKERGEVRP